MRQLIHQNHLRLTRQDRIHIHFIDDNPAILHRAPWNDIQPFHEFGGFSTAVRFHDAHNNINAVGFQPVCFGKHLIGLAHPRAIAEIDLQPPALGAANHLQKTGGPIFTHETPKFSRSLRVCDSVRRAAKVVCGKPALAAQSVSILFARLGSFQSHLALLLSSAKLSINTFTPGSPNIPKSRPSVLASISFFTASSVNPRAWATRAA